MKKDVKFWIHGPSEPEKLVFLRIIKDNVLITYMKSL